MIVFLKAYLIAFVVFFAIDLLWLGIIAKDLYQKYLGHLLKTNVNWVAAIIFYLIFIAGLVFFAIMPAIDKGLWHQALLYGLLFGFMTYATYDLTNLATLKDWPIKITLIDLVWGSFLGASTSTVSYFLYQLIFA